ncbi:STAS domain-containing protein [Streptomyces sp. NPDC021562]|uniref:STAS domain-containing protein n=1 Tax=Streptomyces sp. NPDC021562 TaxID=3155121 RepID=UPI0033CF501B
MLTLSGEVDHHTGDTLRQALDASDTLRSRVVVDMHQVAFMDSSGINISSPPTVPSAKPAAGCAWLLSVNP